MAKYKYSYHEERGRFDAYLEDTSGEIVWEVHYPEFVEDSESGDLIETSTIFEDGYMKHIEDIDGLQKYLVSISIIDEDDEITMSDIEPEVEEKSILYEFVVPNWAMSALINGDYSGLSDEDEDKLNRFIEEVTAEYGNAWFMLPSDDKIDLGFKWRNDIDDLGSDCSLLYIRRSEEMDDSKDFSGGGETSKSRSMQMFGLTQEEYDYRDKIIAKMKSAKGDELKALEEEYAKSDVAKKINKGLSLKAMNKGGTLEERMKNVLTKEFELPIQMAIYVPSTQDVNKIISKREFQDRYEEVAKYVSNLFGGYSADPIDGGYVFNRDLIQEDVVKVVFYADRDSVEKSFKKVYGKIKDWCQEWGQDSMGFEVENDLYYVNSWTKDAANMLFPKSSDSKSDFNELSETDKKEAISKVKEEFRKMKFAGGGDIKDYDNYDDDDDEEEDEGEANLNEISSETGIPVDVLKEYADSIGVDYDRLSDRDINYYGRYGSEEDFMESLVDEGVISGSTLAGYLYMTSTDCRITAGEEADAYVENLDNSVLIDEADLENKLDELNELVEKIEELENDIQEKTNEIEGLEDKLTQTEDEDDSESIKSDIEELREELNDLEDELVNARKDFDNLDYQDEDEIVDAAKDIVRDKQYDYVYDMLDKDPVDYFVHELGAYTEEELAKSSFINIDYEKLARDFASDYEIITGEDGDIYVFTSYKKGGAIGSASVLRTAQKFVNEVNRLIALAYDEDGDPLVVYDTSSTWQSPSIYSPFKLSRGTLYGIEIDYPFGLGSKPTKKRIIVRKADLEFDGIGMLKDVAKMYRRALKQAGIQYKLDSDTNYADGGITLEEQNKQMLLGKTKEYQHHSRELQEIIAKNPMIPAWVIAKATRASTDISDITHYLDSLPVNLKKGGKLWIQGAIKREGSLRKKAKEMGLIKGEEKLSMSDLNRLEALGGVWSKRANLAKTLRRFSEEKSQKKNESGAELENHNYFVDGGSISEEEEQISGESDKVKEISDVVDSLSEDVSEENTELPTKFIGEYKFNVASIPALNKAIETIKKMSKKFGIKPPEIIIGEPRLVGIDYDEIWGEYKYKIDLTPVTIKVENIFKLQEYDVLGVIDNATGGSVKFSDEKIPNEYLNPSEVCDLCKTNRRRGKTWIVKKIGTGEYFRFGSDCVKRVFGINPMTYIRALDYFRKLNDIFSEFDEDSGGREKKRISPKMRVIPFDIALTVVKEVFDKVGYVKKLWQEEELSYGRYEKYRTNEGQATADIIEDKLLNESYSHSVIPNTEFLNNFKGFWQSLEVGNNTKFDEFLNKIKKQVIDEEFRIIDSGMFSFAMHYMAQAKKQAERKPSNYVGVVGEKYDFVNLKVTDKRVFDSQFGTNTLWTFVDENENVIKKFGELEVSFYVGSESGKDARLEYYDEKSSDEDNLRYFLNNYTPKIGDLFSFTAPIKKHEEYRGVKSTLIGRTSKTKPPKKKKLEDGDELEFAKWGGVDEEKWQIQDSKGKFFSQSMSGKPNWHESSDMGYTYSFDEAKSVIDVLNKMGYYDVKAIKYKKQYAKGGGVSDEKIKTFIKKLKEVSKYDLETDFFKRNSETSIYYSWKEYQMYVAFSNTGGTVGEIARQIAKNENVDMELLDIMKLVRIFRDNFKFLYKIKYAKGGGVDRYILSFNYNPSIFKNEDAEKLVSIYTKDWTHDNDWDEVSFFVQGLTKEQAERLADELKMHDVYNIEYELGRYKYVKGGRVQNHYESRTPASIWDYGWNKEQKRHFLSDHSRKIEKELGRQIEFFYADYKFKDLLPQVQKVITNHIYEGQYGKGGGIDDKFEISIYEERFGEYYGSQELPYSEGIKYLDKYRNNKNYKQSCEDGEFFSSIDGHHYVKFKKVKKDKSKYGHGGEVNFNWDKVSSIFYAQPIDYEVEIDGGRIPFFYLHREAEKLNGFDICNANYDAFYDSLSQGAFLCRIKYTDGQIKNGICFSKWDGSKMKGLVCLIDDIQGIKSALEELSFKTRPLVEEGQKEYLKLIGLYDLLKVDGEYAKGGEVEDLDNITDDLLATKIKIFLEKVKPYKNYWLDDKEDILYVYFDTESPIDQYEKAYKEATASMEFFDADGVEITHPKEGSTKMIIPLKKNVIFKYKDYSKDYLEE